MLGWFIYVVRRRSRRFYIGTVPGKVLASLGLWVPRHAQPGQPARGAVEGLTEREPGSDRYGGAGASGGELRQPGNGWNTPHRLLFQVHPEQAQFLPAMGQHQPAQDTQGFRSRCPREDRDAQGFGSLLPVKGTRVPRGLGSHSPGSKQSCPELQQAGRLVLQHTGLQPFPTSISSSVSQTVSIQGAPK